jgi:hypothetical protein
MLFSQADFLWQQPERAQSEAASQLAAAVQSAALEVGQPCESHPAVHRDLAAQALAASQAVSN